MKNCGKMSKEGASISRSLFDVKCSVGGRSFGTEIIWKTSLNHEWALPFFSVRVYKLVMETLNK